MVNNRVWDESASEDAVTSYQNGVSPGMDPQKIELPTIHGGMAKNSLFFRNPNHTKVNAGHDGKSGDTPPNDIGAPNVKNKHVLSNQNHSLAEKGHNSKGSAVPVSLEKATLQPLLQTKICGKNGNINHFVDVKASELMAAWCFQTLINEVTRKRKSLEVPNDLKVLSDAGFETSLFVTWLKKRHGQEKLPFEKAKTELRGCIGTLEPVAILELQKYALKSGMKDRRFEPITEDELRHLKCEISLLRNFEKCRHAYDWEIGVHGIMINFTDHNFVRYTSTFLPEIALEKKMSHRMAIRELIHKAQFYGTVTDAFIEKIEVTRYSSVKSSLSYDKYISGFAHNLEGA